MKTLAEIDMKLEVTVIGVTDVERAKEFYSRLGWRQDVTPPWVVQFTQGAARDLAGSGVRLMALCPGFVRTEFHERAGMGTDNIPGWMWLDADKLVASGLADLARGKTVSIPDARYKVLMGVTKVVPRGMLGAVTSRTGRKYGPQ